MYKLVGIDAIIHALYSKHSMELLQIAHVRHIMHMLQKCARVLPRMVSL